MLRGVKQRLDRVEAFLPLPITAARFYARARQIARHTRRSLGSTYEIISKELSDNELESLAAELERAAFGDDTAARDTAGRETLIAAGYPDWTSEVVEEQRDEGW